jgi:transposase-like protein
MASISRCGMGRETDATMILTALGVDLEGSPEVLAFRACAEEDKEGWSCLLQDLRNRGVSKIDLLVTDGHDGRLSAVAALFPATLRQRCLVHKQRNVLTAIAKRERASGRCRPDWQLEARDQRASPAESGGEHSPTSSSALPRRCAASARTKTTS